MPAPEHDLLFAYPPELQSRRRAAGFGLYAALGIARDDRDRREEQYRENFAFFGAPAVAFLFVHEALGAYAVLDAGIFLQSYLLAAYAEGLGTCAQASLASYPSVVRRHFDVPPGHRLRAGCRSGGPHAIPRTRFAPARMASSELLLPPTAAAAARAAS